MRQPIPLARRPLDVALIAFFAVNLFFTTYVFAAFTFGRLLPRRAAIRIMGRATHRLYG